jgi:hypothetical protein
VGPGFGRDRLELTFGLREGVERAPAFGGFDATAIFESERLHARILAFERSDTIENRPSQREVPQATNSVEHVAALLLNHSDGGRTSRP